MRLRRIRLLLTIGVFLFVLGVVLPVAGSSIATYETERADDAVDGPECDPPEFIDEDESSDDDSVRTGMGRLDTECLADHEAEMEEERRDWVMRLSSLLVAGGPVFQLGGLVWITMGLWGRQAQNVRA